MTSSQKRTQLKKYIEQVDDDYLDILETLLEDRLRLSANDLLAFSDEEIAELEKIEKSRQSGEGSGDTLENVSKRLYKHLEHYRKSK